MKPKYNIAEKIKELPDKEYFTVTEVVEMTGLHVRTVQARLRDGTLKGKKIGREWRIYPESLKNNNSK